MRKSTVSFWMVLALLACRSDKPEVQVRKAFEVCRAAVEAGDAAAATAPLDPAFFGPGGMDKATARLFLMGIFRQEKVGVTVLRNGVFLREKEAVQAIQEVDLLLTGRQGLLPRDATQRRFRLRWRKAGGEWRLMEVQELDGPSAPGTP